MRGIYTFVGLLVLLGANAMAQTTPFSGRRCSFGSVMDVWGEGGDAGYRLCAVTSDGVNVDKCTDGKPLEQPKKCGPMRMDQNCTYSPCSPTGKVRAYTMKQDAKPDKGKIENKPQAGGGWDTWLESTGNKAKVAPQLPTASVRVVGSAPAGIDEVIKACRHLVDDTGPGKPGIGSIYEVQYLSAVDAATVYGQHGPQGKLTPLKMYAKFRDGENLYANGYLHKDTFGTLKCIRAN